ncbi:allophanate hydrolase [Exilibacterium tricleocarpae]|uniref:Allophanate hydrolase n=1 Tax=Exilibacterium tricleocarpae TaxID=2591008 RepID=A0A545TAP2_9GAMM|nr:allophanate hydrolase [Exilibacterium tricleocarpae]
MFNLRLPVLRENYRNGVTTPRELIFTLRRQAEAQADYNAWVTLLDERQLENHLAFLEGQSPDTLPLYGIPFAIKDNIDLAGVPTTAGCPDFAYTPPQSAPVVTALLAAGAIPLGKTNLDQFATGLVGVRSPYGEGKNAFNPDYISGGSSAGSAIATALGQVSFALGTDTAGSGRVPAVLNNLIGHKPSKGLISTRGVVPACRSLDCVSLFALHTDDIAILWDLVTQFDPLDPYARSNHYANRNRYYAAAAPAAFRFGVPRELDFQGDGDIRTLFEKSVEHLSRLGGTPVPIDFEPFLSAARLLYEGPWVAERQLATKDVAREALLPVIRQVIDGSATGSAADAFAAQYRLAALKRQCDNVMADVDILLTPTTPTLYARADIAKDPIRHNASLGTYTNFMNLLDYCGTAVPVGFTDCGVPWGVTLFATAFADIEVLSFAGALQRACRLPLGATRHTQPELTSAAVLTPPRTIDIVVCGAHLQGQPLNWQLTERGGKLKELTASSANYQLFALADGKRPAMIRNVTRGCAIEVEVWTLPAETFGDFVAAIPAPLGIGKVELADGRWLSGFICDGYGTGGAKNITEFGGWRSWLQQTS